MAVPWPTRSRGEVVGVGELRIVVGVHQQRDVTAGDDHLAIRVRAVALGEAGGKGQGIVLEAGMLLVDTGVDDPDLDSGAGVARSAHAVPRIRHVHQVESTVEMAPEARHALHSPHAGDGAQFRGARVRRRREHRIGQQLHRPGNRDAALRQLGANRFLRLDNVLQTRLRGGGAQGCTRCGLLGHGCVFEHQRIF